MVVKWRSWSFACLVGSSSELEVFSACSPSDTLQLPVGAVHIPLRNCTLTASAGKHKIQ